MSQYEKVGIKMCRNMKESVKEMSEFCVNPNLTVFNRIAETAI